MIRTRDLALKLTFPKASCSKKAPWASFLKSMFRKQRKSATSAYMAQATLHGIYHLSFPPKQSLRMWKWLGSEPVCRGSYVDALRPRLKTFSNVKKTSKRGRFAFGMPSGETCYNSFETRSQVQLLSPMDVSSIRNLPMSSQSVSRFRKYLLHIPSKLNKLAGQWIKQT